MNTGHTLTLQFLKTHPKIFIFYVLVIFVMLPFEVYFLPRFTSQFITGLHKNIFEFSSLYPMIAAMSFVTFGMLYKTRIENVIIPKFIVFIRKHVFNEIIKKHQSAVQSLPLGKIISVLSEYPNSVRTIFVTLVRTYIPYFIAVCALLAYFFTFHYSIGLLNLSLLCIIIIVLYFDNKKCVETSKNAHIDIINLNETIQDRLSNIMSVYMSQQENTEMKNHSMYQDKNRKLYYDSLQCGWKSNVKVDTIGMISFICFGYLLYTLYTLGTVTITDLTQVFIAQVYYFQAFMRRMQNNIFDVMNSYGSVKAMEQYLNQMDEQTEYQEVQEKSKTKTAQHTKIKKTPYGITNKGYTKHVTLNDEEHPICLKIDNLYFKYPKSNKWAIHNFSMMAKYGERIWLKGHSGCGKSTLIKLILVALRPTRGIIRIGVGLKDTTKHPVHETRKHISFVDQDTKLFNDTVFENIRYGNKHIKLRDVKQKLKKLNVTIFDKLGNGLLTNVGINGDQMSGGQKQTILILRSFFRNASIILMDEPLSAIDVTNVPEILELIQNISQNRLLLVISHNDKIASLITREVDVCAPTNS